MKKLLIILSLFISTLTANAETILFVGDGCPHCDTVEEYIAENNLTQTLDLQILEVFYDELNRNLYLLKAEELGYSDKRVPWLVHDNTYKEGTVEIISFLDNRLIEELTEKVQPTTISNSDSSELNKTLAANINSGTNSPSESNLPLPLYQILLILISISLGAIFLRKGLRQKK